MVGRGALVKPWIFEEFRLGRELLPTTEERVGEYCGVLPSREVRWRAGCRRGIWTDGRAVAQAAG